MFLFCVLFLVMFYCYNLSKLGEKLLVEFFDGVGYCFNWMDGYIWCWVNVGNEDLGI